MTKPGRNRRLRHALEARHESYRTKEVSRLLRRHRVALVVSHSPDWPLFEEVTADFVYIRLHGGEKTYVTRYDDPALDWWAEPMRAWAAGGEPADASRISTLSPPRRQSRELYVYFDNDQQGHAPHDALRLADRLGAGPVVSE